MLPSKYLMAAEVLLGLPGCPAGACVALIMMQTFAAAWRNSPKLYYCEGWTKGGLTRHRLLQASTIVMLNSVHHNSCMPDSVDLGRIEGVRERTSKRISRSGISLWSLEVSLEADSTYLLAKQLHRQCSCKPVAEVIDVQRHRKSFVCHLGRKGKDCNTQR